MFRCEFASRNLNGCPSNQYYTSIEPVPTVPGGQRIIGKREFTFLRLCIRFFLETSNEPWKVFIQSREQFSCSGSLKRPQKIILNVGFLLGKQDGFYASRWCNVFYRCYTGISSAFLCPKMPSGARLWWVQHGSPQGVAQETAACTWPCETGRRCSSSGGIIADSGSIVSESQQEAETVFSQSLCTSASSTNTDFASPQSPIPSGSTNSNPSGRVEGRLINIFTDVYNESVD